MEIIACPRCGSRRIYQGRMSDGVLTGYTSRNVCRDCGYQGTPIILDSEKDYINFLKNVKQKQKNKPKKEVIIKGKNKNIKTERPFGLTILTIIIILQALLAIYFYYEFVGFDNTIWLWIYYIVIFTISAIILPYGLLLGRSWAWTLGGMLFALSIPIGLVFLYYITRPYVKKYFGKN